MKYQAFMKKIMQQLTEYKGVVDTLSISYQSEVAKREKEFEEMSGKYTDEYIKESRQNWKPSKDYSGEIGVAREKHQQIAGAYIAQIEKELDSYFQIPVDSGFAATVTAIKALGVTPNNREFELLQGASGGYWGRRLLNELAVSRTKTEQRAELDDKNEMKRVEKEVKMPYGLIELPDIEKVYDSLQSVKNAVNIAFEGYCGEGYALKDIIFPISEAQEATNAKLSEAYGIPSQKQMLDNVTISKMASSVKCFDENYRPYAVFSDIMGEIAATVPEPERKTVLTDSDRKLIDTLINSNYPSLAKDDAIRIAKADERLGELLLLDERYGKAVRAAIGEVLDNE